MANIVISEINRSEVIAAIQDEIQVMQCSFEEKDGVVRDPLTSSRMDRLKEAVVLIEGDSA